MERSLLSANAETPGEGRQSWSIRQGLFLSGTHAFTDDLQLTLGGLAPLGPQLPLVVSAQGKHVVTRTDGATIALRATGLGLRPRGGAPAAGAVGVGVLVDRQSRLPRAMLHGGLSVHRTVGPSFSRFIPFEGDQFMGLFEAGIRAQATHHVALLAEAWLPLLWTGPDNIPSRPALFPWGARFHSQRLAVDVGFIAGQIGRALPWSLPIGAPYLSVGGAFGRESE